MLEILEAASSDLTEACGWYDERLAGLGDRLLAEVRSVFEFIERNPAAGSPWLLKGIPPGVRHVPLRTFPYSVVYVLAPRLVVVAVAHGSQEPTYWIDRLDDIGTAPDRCHPFPKSLSREEIAPNSVAPSGLEITSRTTRGCRPGLVQMRSRERYHLSRQTLPAWPGIELRQSLSSAPDT